MKTQPRTSMFRATLAVRIVAVACVLAQAAVAAKSAPATAPVQRGCLYLYYGCLRPATAATNSDVVRTKLKKSLGRRVCVYGAYICRIQDATVAKNPLPARVLLTAR